MYHMCAENQGKFAAPAVAGGPQAHAAAASEAKYPFEGMFIPMYPFEGVFSPVVKLCG